MPTVPPGHALQPHDHALAALSRLIEELELIAATKRAEIERLAAGGKARPVRDQVWVGH